MFALVHRYRKPFVLLNGLAIVLVGGGAALLGERFWALHGVTVGAGGSPLLRLLGWYLLVHGVGAILISRAPEKNPVVLAMVGLEKIGAVACFGALLVAGPFSVSIVFLAGFDAAMAGVFLGYTVWVLSPSTNPSASRIGQSP